MPPADDEDDLKHEGGRNGSAHDDQDSRDSDLFFDFDIAPEETATAGIKSDVVAGEAATAKESEATEGATSSNEVPQWDQKQQQPQSAAERSSPTAVKPVPKKSPASPLVSPDSLLDEPVVPDLLLDGEEEDNSKSKVESSSDDDSDDDDDEGDLTFVKGDCKHTVASSTLSSLVAMLEKESSRSKGRFRSELPTIAASPATTSFLSGTQFNGNNEGFE